MKYTLLLLGLASLVFFTSCHRNDMDKDATAFADLKCQLKEIDTKSKTGELNFIETEDAKEPIFEEMDVFRRRYRLKKQEFDSLIVIKVDEFDCKYD